MLQRLPIAFAQVKVGNILAEQDLNKTDLQESIP